DSAVADMRQLVDSLNLASEVIIETPAPFYEPYTLEEDHPLIKDFLSAYQTINGESPVFGYGRGITDANIYVAEGNIPTVTYGPRGHGFHECNEHVEIDSLLPVAQVFAQTVINFFG
ncbi:MAG: M20/M25/M40 family metallo-hydrolase, partial [Chloroflexota bacterium]